MTVSEEIHVASRESEIVILGMYLQIPLEGGSSTHKEEIVIPKSRINSDEPVEILTQRIREKLSLD